MTRINIGDPPDGLEEEVERLQSFSPWVWTALGIVVVTVLAVVLAALRPDWMPTLDIYSSGPAHVAADTHHYPH